MRSMKGSQMYVSMSPSFDQIDPILQVAQLTEQASERSAGRNSEGAAETKPREDFQILGQGAYGVVSSAPY